MEAYNKLKKLLQHKWDFVTMQAEEQVSLFAQNYYHYYIYGKFTLDL